MRKERHMRKLKLQYCITDSRANVVGLIFCEYLNRQKKEDVFSISNHKLQLEIVVDDPNEKIMTLISELPFDKVESLSIEDIHEESDTKNESNDDGSKESNASSALINNEETAAKPKEEGEKSKEPRSVVAKSKGARIIPEMDEVGKSIFERTAKEAKSFNEFIMKMGEFIGINISYQLFFYSLVKAACDVDTVNLDEISKNMEQYGEGFNNSKKITVSQLVKKSFARIGSSSRFLTVLAEFIKYKDYKFSDEIVIDDDTCTKTQNVSADETKKDSMEEGYKVLSKELLDLTSDSKLDFFKKVEIILDTIRVEDDDNSYDSMSKDLVRVMVKTTKDISEGINLKDAMSNNAIRLFGEKGYIAEACIYQSIKNYCLSVGYESDSMYEAFFEDLTKLM